MAKKRIHGQLGASGSDSGFVFSKGDLEILRAVHEFRFLRREHLSLITGRDPKRIHRRLVKLVERGLLAATRLPQQKHIYSIGRAGISELIAQGTLTGDPPVPRLRVKELKELFLKHEMLIVDHHLLFMLGAKFGPFRLVTWREGRELFDAVVVRDSSGMKRLPVRPDAFLTLGDNRRDEGRNQFSFFLEIDRSTMPHKNFAEKILAYWHYREQGLHAKKWKIRGFRVLTVTLTDARARNLQSLAATILPERARKHFMFAALENYSFAEPQLIFDNIWLTARDGDGIKFPLIPEPE